MTTLVIILVLVGVAVAALASVPLMIRSTRRHAVGAGPRKPIMGSPAQVWVSRGERVLRELTAELAEHTAWRGIASDAGQVVEKLRTTAGQVAELDHALARIQDPTLAAAGRLRQARESLLVRMRNAVTGLEQARAEVLELTATARASTVVADPDPASELNSRLAGLRAGLIEVRELADPEAGSGMDRGDQGHP